MHRYLILFDDNADSDCLANSLRVEARPPRGGVTQAVYIAAGSQHSGYQVVERGAVADDGQVELQSLTLAHHGHAVLADAAAQDYFIARPGVGARNVRPPFDQADPGGIDEQAVRLAAVDYLGIAGNDLLRRPHQRFP